MFILWHFESFIAESDLSTCNPINHIFCYHLRLNTDIGVLRMHCNVEWHWVVFSYESQFYLILWITGWLRHHITRKYRPPTKMNSTKSEEVWNYFHLFVKCSCKKLLLLQIFWYMRLHNIISVNSVFFSFVCTPLKVTTPSYFL